MLFLVLVITRNYGLRIIPRILGKKETCISLFTTNTTKKHNNRTEELPPVGFEVLALVLKLEGGSGGPARSTFRKCDRQEILNRMSYQ